MVATSNAAAVDAARINRVGWGVWLQPLDKLAKPPQALSAPVKWV